eukprot:scaffold27189_cov45-Phaeocystis_antarctica.AAC.1
MSTGAAPAAAPPKPAAAAAAAPTAAAAAVAAAAAAPPPEQKLKPPPAQPLGADGAPRDAKMSIQRGRSARRQLQGSRRQDKFEHDMANEALGDLKKLLAVRVMARAQKLRNRSGNPAPRRSSGAPTAVQQSVVAAERALRKAVAMIADQHPTEKQ